MPLSYVLSLEAEDADVFKEKAQRVSTKQTSTKIKPSTVMSKDSSTPELFQTDGMSDPMCTVEVQGLLHTEHSLPYGESPCFLTCSS